MEYEVVIIDSGVNIANNSHAHGITIQKNGSDVFEYIDKDCSDKTGHGSIIYSIINKYIPRSDIFVIKLSDRLCDNDDSYLYAALEYIKNNIKCKVINISLGFKTCEEIRKLDSLCTEMASLGYVIVSAFDNEGCLSFPAALDCVIGVDSSNDIINADEYVYVENSPINILAKGGIQRVKSEEGNIVITSGSSIACAYVTSLISRAAVEKFNIHTVKEYLKSKAKYIHVFEDVVKNGNEIFEIKNAAIFPFSKEEHAFLRFEDLLSFTIKGYYDVRRSGKVGRQLSFYYDSISRIESVKDIEQIVFEGIDTIILGHLDELNRLIKRDYRGYIIKKAIEAGVNIYSFDPLDLYNDILQNANINYFYPQIDVRNVPHNSFGKLYKISKPVLGIFGTSSQQGKFTLQLSLKRELEKCGYNVGSIGTEPHSLLFGLDYVFPMGYNSTVNISNHQIVTFLNYNINNLCYCEKEIILVASQAAFIPYAYNNLRESPSMQYHFAIGTQPDVIVLCINYFDDISYIRNSIMALAGLTGAEIIALVMYPVTYVDDWRGLYGSKKAVSKEEYELRAKEIFAQIRIPVFLLGNNQHMRDICRIVIDYF